MLSNESSATEIKLTVTTVKEIELTSTMQANRRQKANELQNAPNIRIETILDVMFVGGAESGEM